MIRLWLAVAGIGGFAAVTAGATAAHFDSDPASAELLRTGALYGMVHATALLAVIALSGRRRAVLVAGWSFALGSVLFSFSLYGLALGGARWLGAATPVGGVALIVGWLALAVAALRRPA
jgi:uncharacterized membrane protein YgdD (TMEM256/DUF423 family)